MDSSPGTLSPQNSSEEMSPLSDKMKESFKHVMKKLDVIDRLILRKTCRDMRQLVDNSKFHCDEFILHFWEDDDDCFIGINKWCIFYNREGAVFCDDDDGDAIHLKVSEKFASDERSRLKMMCYDAEKFLKNPNLTIEKLEIEIGFPDASNHLIAMIKKLNRPIHVEEVYILGQFNSKAINTIIPTLQILVPMILKKIKINCSIKDMKLWREIMETEHWKMAEVFKTDFLPNEFPLEELFHFKKIGCRFAKVGTERLKKIRDDLIKRAHFECLEIKQPTGLASTDKISRIFENVQSENTFSPKIGGFLIPNSKDYFCLCLRTERERRNINNNYCFIIERTAIEEDTVDSKVENDYPDASAINKFILKAALKDENDFESYQEWCQNPKNPKIEFLDFEWRFYKYVEILQKNKFHQGSPDLSIEKRPESSLTLNDLTNEVLEKIVERTDMFDRLVLRKVSRNLRGIVDKTNADCKRVFLCFGYNGMRFGWETEVIEYLRAEKEDEFGFEVHCVSVFEETKTKELNLTEDVFAHLMTSDARIFLKTPNQKIGRFSIYTYHTNGPIIKRVVDFLNSLNFKIRANELNLYYNDPFHEILPFFDSNYLKKLCLKDKMKTLKKSENDTARNEDDEAEKELEKVIKMEIWTKIEIFQMDCRLPDKFPIEKLFHFKEITIKSMKLTEERLVKIRDILLKTPQFNSACFPLPEEELPMENVDRSTVSDDEDDDFFVVKIETRWKLIDGIMSQDAAYDSGNHRFSINGSKEYYQLKIGYSCCSTCRRSAKLHICRTLENENSKKENSKKENLDDSDEDKDDSKKDDEEEDKDDDDDHPMTPREQI